MRTNTATKKIPAFNHEGTPVKNLNAEQELRRSVMACMLWEDGFYEDGVSHAERVAGLIKKLPFETVAEIAVEAREKMKLRHMPLFLARELVREYNGREVGDLIHRIIQRPDELSEFLALYWKEGKTPVAKQVKLGLARAFRKFNEYSLAKFNRDADIKLRDVLFLTHAKPKDAPDRQYTAAERRAKRRVKLSPTEQLYKRIAEDELTTPDTWEVALSGGADKREVFTRLIQEDKLGALALLRNLRNMVEARVPADVIRKGLRVMKVERVLPFRFIAAARYAPQFEPELEEAMFRCLENAPTLRGKTALVVDTSPSMWQARISSRSEMNRFEAAAALAILCREVCEHVAVYAFNHQAYVVPTRRGFALRDALQATQGQASCGGLAVEWANKDGYDRIIVLTDGEWHFKDAYSKHFIMAGVAKDVSPLPLTKQAYMLNVATTQNGVGYGKWTSIDGWSEAVIEYIRACEGGLA